ncbi:hypothetical protein Hanom_Chr17g01582131 [Helianthus anomalus]
MGGETSFFFLSHPFLSHFYFLFFSHVKLSREQSVREKSFLYQYSSTHTHIYLVNYKFCPFMLTPNYRRCHFFQKLTGSVLYLLKSCTLCPLGQT